MHIPLFPRSSKTAAAHAVLFACASFLLIACGGDGGGGSSNVAGGSGGGGASTTTFTVSGEITFATNTAIDSDVNDPEAPYASNDLYNDPLHPENGINVDDLVQRVSRLVTVGGYVNQPDEGVPGRSFETGDVSDFFVADLMAGQTITLNAAESDSNIDLYLYVDGDFVVPVDSSENSAGEDELIRVATAGTYFIKVLAVSGFSNYTLNITADPSGSQAASFAAENDFVPGEVIVKFKDTGVKASSTGLVSAGMAPMGLTAKAGEPSRAMLFGLNDANRKAQVSSRLSTAPGTNPPLSLDPELQRKLETLTVISELKNRADVAYAEPNYIRRQQLAPSDDLYLRQWHYPLINLPKAWDTTTGNADVVVAVVDTGVLFDHPDLSGKLTATGYDFVSDPDSALDGDGIDPDPTDAQKSGNSIFHGSHVAGTIAAQTDNGEGVAGVGWNTSIMPVRALGEGGIGTNYDIMQAVRYAAGLLNDVTGLPDNDSGTVPAQKADIINLSLSGTNESAFEQYIYDKVRAEGIIVVAAAGNNASNQPVYPAAYNGVLAVSAADINEQLAWYSNFGSYVDLAAPGGDLSVDLDGDGYRDGVLSTAADVDSNGNLSYSYSYLEGTSMAAAHVSGVLALMKAVNPALTPDDIEGLLLDGSITQDLGDPGSDDRYGFGLIDSQKAVLAAPMQDVPITDTLLTVSRDQIPLGSTLSSAEITVDKNGNDTITVQSVTFNADWLKIEEINPGDGKSGNFPTQYRVHADRTDLAPGEYRATISFVSGNNTVEVSVFMQVVDVADVADGALYVQLRDPKSFETVYQKTVYSEGGLYRFNFDGVAAGRYLISAGTDLDNDKVIGDGGEAYLSLAQPVILQVDQNLSGLDFGAGFNLTLSAQSRQAAEVGRRQEFIPAF